MIGEKVQGEINHQINRELFSAYLYLSMAGYFASEGLEGFSHWMRVQAREEVDHAMRLFDHVLERGGSVELDSIDRPEGEWGSPLDAFEAAYAHEQKVTGHIDDLAATAEEEGDRASANLLDWFIEEQVEEEDSALSVVERLRKAEGDPGALLFIDRELGDRAAPGTGERSSGEA